MLHAPCSRGFSIVELLVSIAIFTLITGIVVVSSGRFGGSVLITNLAYDVALSIRQAQVYGISVKQNSTGSFQYYGIHFGPTGYFILFSDLDGSLSYNTAANDNNGCLGASQVAQFPECVSFFKIEKGNYISAFCGGTDCAGGAINGLDIIFRRPEPEPLIHGFLGLAPVGTYTTASITVTSPIGLSKIVDVSSSGQISVR